MSLITGFLLRCAFDKFIIGGRWSGDAVRHPRTQQWREINRTSTVFVTFSADRAFDDRQNPDWIAAGLRSPDLDFGPNNAGFLDTFP